ncbi:hypothetical protein SEA_GENAMY16_50 [Gordonia phage Genamy16]|uniref:Uncharacterized protein n=2 Tax=Lambovirus TaxID=2843412 RepID=A0A9E7Q3E1_9CAUD|nr:hypothetical protein SEA_GENAMY16_50 [Gordonia phage Genamy16]UVF61803.1 hypothetical protein SEA_NOVASHARKS_49 [Gordonia phage NovaSharks]WNM65354.1 hypothetical protein SEA_ALYSSAMIRACLE_50 [Gordonia phage Alyssamiracle]
MTVNLTKSIEASGAVSDAHAEYVHKLRPSYNPRHTVVCFVCGATDPDRPDGCKRA